MSSFTPAVEVHFLVVLFIFLWFKRRRASLCTDAPLPSEKIEGRGGGRLYTGYVESVRKRTLSMSDQMRCLFYSDLNSRSFLFSFFSV